MKKYRNGALRGRARPMTLVIFCGLLWSAPLAAQLGPPPPHAATLLLPGIPSGMTVTHSWREKTQISYVPAEGTDLEDLHTLDLFYMEPKKTDERVLMGGDGSDSTIFICHVLNPSAQFNAQTLAYSHMVSYQDSMRVYAPNDSLMYSRETPVGAAPSLATVASVLQEVLDTLGAHLVELPDGRIFIGLDGLELTLDSAGSAWFVRVYGPDSLWLRSEFIQMDPSDSLRIVPVSHLIVTRDTSPMGACIFRVEQRDYAEYYPKSNPLVRPPQVSAEAVAHLLEVFPNPAAGRIYVNLPAGLDGKPVHVELYSLDGRLLLERRTEGGLRGLELELPQQAKGICLVRVRSGSSVWTQKLILE